MKHTFLWLLTALTFVSTAQTNSVSMDSCIHWAKIHYPVIKQNEYYSNQSALNEKSIREIWYPKLSFVGQATYNTEVVQFNFPGMDLKFPHDAYMTALNLEQTLVDGGQAKHEKRVEHLSTEINKQQNEAELYKLVERVNQLYVNILLGRENLAILNLYKADLSNREANLTQGVKNGLVLESSLNEIQAELLKTDQNIVESTYNLQALYQNLSYYIDRQVNEATEFQLIAIGGNVPKIEVQRPELKVFELQTKLYEARYQQTNVFAMPHVSLGASANYGRPGPNFINQELRLFGSANLTVRWNISSLYGLKREKQKLNLNKSLVEIQKETFLFTIQTSLNSQLAQLNALGELIATDDLIIEKRILVTQTAVSQMENGKITVANYLTQLNAELQAKLNKKVHEIKRMNAISMINATSGSFQF